MKAGVNPRSKSLRSFDSQFAPRLLIRSTLLNLKRDARVLNIPLYALPNGLRFIGHTPCEVDGSARRTTLR